MLFRSGHKRIKRRKSKQEETDEIRESKTVMGSDEVGKGMEKETKKIVFIELGEYFRIKSASVRRKKQR